MGSLFHINTKNTNSVILLSNMIKINTVTGSINEEQLGITLMHEHILNDASRLWNKPDEASRMNIAEQKISMDMLYELKYDPYMNKDNLVLDDIDDAVYEVEKFKAFGGNTIIDAGNRYMGRKPYGLREISNRSGLNIIMSTGYHLADTYPADFPLKSVDDIASEIISEIESGVNNTGIKAGIIGEIGVSAEISPDEIKSLKGSCIAQLETQVPLTIHTDGWSRNHHEILEIVVSEGVNLNTVILEHMNPCCYEPDFLISLLEHGVYLEFDMIGMDMYYPGVGQSPADEQVALCILKLIEKGFSKRLLLSHDTFLKMMLTKYGGPGYAHIPRAFVPRLKRLGVGDDDIMQMLACNPKQIFISAANNQ